MEWLGHRFEGSGLWEYFEITPQNVNRARVRMTPEKYRGFTGSGTAPRDPVGNITPVPSDDEFPQVTTSEVSLAPTPFPILDPEGRKVSNPKTARHTAPASSRDAPDPKAPVVDSLSVSKEDKDFATRHALSPPASYLVTVTTGHVQLTGRAPTRDWPP